MAFATWLPRANRNGISRSIVVQTPQRRIHALVRLNTQNFDNPATSVTLTLEGSRDNAQTFELIVTATWIGGTPLPRSGFRQLEIDEDFTGYTHLRGSLDVSGTVRVGIEGEMLEV